MIMTTNDITMTDAELKDLERDIRTFINDDPTEADPIDLLAEVVADSDFVPDDERSAVALEMYERILEPETNTRIAEGTLMSLAFIEFNGATDEQTRNDILDAIEGQGFDIDAVGDDPVSTAYVEFPEDEK